MKKKVLIAGSGISGISIARMLQNNYEVEVFEKKEKTGGLIKCERINGHLFHMVGGHVFNSKNPAVLDWFWAHFDKETEFIQANRNAKILIKNKTIGYPIENFIYELPKEDATAIFNELLALNTKKHLGQKTKNFDSYLKNSFGSSLYKLYFQPYNEKIWQTNLSAIPLDWLKGKLPMPDIKEIILNNILKENENKMVHSSFYYPVKNGSQFIIDRLSKGIEIKTSSDVVSVKKTNKKLLINDKYASEILIYCGDIRDLYKIIDINDKALRKALLAVRDLTANGTSNVLCETDETDISWLYLPEKKFMAHRIIYTGNFSKTNNKSSKRKSCVVEFSGTNHKKQGLLNEIKKMPGNLEPIAFNIEKSTYVINTSDTRAKVEKARHFLKKYNIYLLGRFAEWKYYNMDQCIENALELRDSLCAQ